MMDRCRMRYGFEGFEGFESLKVWRVGGTFRVLCSAFRVVGTEGFEGFECLKVWRVGGTFRVLCSEFRVVGTEGFEGFEGFECLKVWRVGGRSVFRVPRCGSRSFLMMEESFCLQTFINRINPLTNQQFRRTTWHRRRHGSVNWRIWSVPHCRRSFDVCILKITICQWTS